MLLHTFTCLCLLITHTLPAFFDFTEVAEKQVEAVVSIRTESDVKQQNYKSYMDTYGHTKPQGQGSGLLTTPDGYILTNNHVIRQATTIMVILNDGRRFPASLVGADPKTDLAVIKINERNLPYLTLANSNTLRVGQWVCAIGNPLGLSASVSVGVLSAIGRSDLNLTRFEDFLQTDAAINKGNSGGPLLNLEGEVIGVNTAIASSTGGYMGIGFAIPSNIAKNIMNQLIATGTVTRGFLDITVQEVTAEIADSLGLQQAEGIVVTDVMPDSQAERAGLREGDVIIEHDQKPLASVDKLRNAVSLKEPGGKMVLGVIRDGSPIEVAVTIGTPPSAEERQNSYMEELGLEVTTHDQGVLVTAVQPNSAAARAELRAGQVILSVNKQPVRTRQEFFNALLSLPEGSRALLLVKQGSTKLFITFKR